MVNFNLMKKNTNYLEGNYSLNSLTYFVPKNKTIFILNYKIRLDFYKDKTIVS